MSVTASIANIIPGTMALSLAGKSAQMIPKTYRSQQSWLGGNGKKKSKDKNMIKDFTGIMIGTTMIKPVAGMISGL